MRARLRLGPRPGVAAVPLQPAQAFVPGGVELDLVATVAVAVEEFRLGRVFVGEAAVFDPFRAADFGAARRLALLDEGLPVTKPSERKPSARRRASSK